jgi:hypothetical protein
VTQLIRPYLTFGIAMLAAGAIVAVAPPVALAGGGLGGTGTGTVSGPGGTVLGTVTGQLTGNENIPGGTPGAPGCITGGCSGNLAAGIVTGPGGTPLPTGLQITPTVTLPQPSAIACITAQCHGSGGLSGTSSVQTPIVGVSGGLNGYIHG